MNNLSSFSQEFKDLSKDRYGLLVPADENINKDSEIYESANPTVGVKEEYKEMHFEYLKKWVETLKLLYISSDRRISELECHILSIEKFFKDIKLEIKLVKETAELEQKVESSKEAKFDPFNPANNVLPDITKKEYKKFYEEE